MGMASQIPPRERLACDGMLELINAVHNPSTEYLERLERFAELGFPVPSHEDTLAPYLFLISFENSRQDLRFREALTVLGRRLLPRDYSVKLYIGDRPEPALLCYLTFALRTPRSPVAALLREPDQLLRVLRKVPLAILEWTILSLESFWKAPGKDPELIAWAQSVTQVIIERLPMTPGPANFGSLVNRLVQSGQIELLSRAIARGYVFESYDSNGGLRTLMKIAQCKGDIPALRLLTAQLPPPRSFPLEPWLDCLPAREAGGELSALQESLRAQRSLGGSFGSDVMGLSPAQALNAMGWPELALEFGPDDTTPQTKEASERWLARRLASIAGEDVPLLAPDFEVPSGEAQEPTVQLLKLGKPFAPHYLLHGATGNVNTGYTLFGTDPQGHPLILMQTGGYDFKPQQSHHGLRDIHVAARSSAAMHCETLWRFDGKQYQEAVCHETGYRDDEHLVHRRVRCPPRP
jgi:hypothetical protein